MQTLPDRYKAYRLDGFTAVRALTEARNTTEHSHATPYINPEFYREPARGYPTGAFRWIEKVSKLNWRLVGYADEIVNLCHRGWYCDELFDDVYRGIVYRLPNGRFLYGYADPWNDDSALIANDIATDETDAARSADHVAQRFAETDMDHSRAYHTTQRALEAAAESRETAREAIQDLRALETCDSPRIKERIHENFTTAWNAYRSAMTAFDSTLYDAQPHGITKYDLSPP